MRLLNRILNYKVSPDWELDKKRAYHQVNGLLALMGTMALLGIFVAYFFGLQISVFIQIAVTICYFTSFSFIRNHNIRAAKLFSIYSFEIAMLLNSIFIIFPTTSAYVPYVSTVVFIFVLYPIIAALLDLSIKLHVLWAIVHLAINIIILKLLPSSFLSTVQSSNIEISIIALTAFSIIMIGGLVILIYSEQNFVKQRKTEHASQLQNTLNELNKTLIKVENQKLQIEKQSEELQLLNNTKNRFFSIVAHDLRSPFNSLLGFIDLLKTEEYDEEDKKKIINILHESASTAYGLVNNLLDWSRTQFNQTIVNPEHLNLKLKVNNCIKIVESLAWNKDIKIINMVDGGLTVYADKEMVHSILRNLLTNSIKFTENTGIISINASVKKDCVEIVIKDNGVGMTKECSDKLFSEDKHQSRLGTAKEKGTGLGLVLCHEFIKKHNGKIWVESEIGKGSTFFIQLPKFKQPNIQ